jgi:imidazolonepropionase-like amidohydrolase
MTMSDAAQQSGRPLVFRGGTVLTMDDASTVLTDADVLVVDDRIAAVGPKLDVPEGTQEIDATGGVVMPGMIDTHRHMWQTAMRGYGADWTLTQYFVWYYLEHGKKFRPTTARPRSTRCARCPAGSSWPTATSRPGRGSGAPTPPSARCWSGCATPATT